MGGGGRRRSLQAVVCRAAAGRHGGAWSVVAFLASCAACASRERVRPAAWRRRGAGLSRHPLCPLVRGKKKCVLRGCVASVRLSRARARWWEGGVRFGSACGTHPCRPPPPFGGGVPERREKKMRKGRGGGEEPAASRVRKERGFRGRKGGVRPLRFAAAVCSGAWSAFACFEGKCACAFSALVCARGRSKVRRAVLVAKKRRARLVPPGVRRPDRSTPCEVAEWSLWSL